MNCQTTQNLNIEWFFSYNTMSHRIARKVRVLNALPRFMRGTVLWIYNTLAWVIARKGL